MVFNRKTTLKELRFYKIIQSKHNKPGNKFPSWYFRIGVNPPKKWVSIGKINYIKLFLD